MTLKAQIKSIEKEIINIRRQLHQYPELSDEEFQTQALIIAYLKKHHITCEPCAKTGVVASIGFKKPCIGIRADIDALPIQERTSLPYRSRVPHVMHACGHDVHAAILLGTARILKSMENDLDNSVKLFFQPAEETIGGACRMIKEGGLKGVDYIFGLHVMPYLNNGQIELKSGQLNASSNSIKLTIKGRSCHGAYPEKGVDSIVVASHLIVALQTIVSRNTSPLDAVVLSFGSIHGGEKANILCDSVTLNGTLRTLTPESRAHSLERLREIIEHVTKAHGATYALTISDGYEPLINNNEMVMYLQKTLQTDFEILHKSTPSMGVEDFSFFSNRVKGAFYHLGCGDGIATALHQNNFNVDEACIASGILSQVKLVLNAKYL